MFVGVGKVGKTARTSLYELYESVRVSVFETKYIIFQHCMSVRVYSLELIRKSKRKRVYNARDAVQLYAFLYIYPAFSLVHPYAVDSTCT